MSLLFKSHFTFLSDFNDKTIRITQKNIEKNFERKGLAIPKLVYCKKPKVRIIINRSITDSNKFKKMYEILIVLAIY